MGMRERTQMQRHGERGNTIFYVAGFLFILLGIGALAIDLASLYVARTQAQRAADSAALAGAKVFVESGCVTIGNCSLQETSASDRAGVVAGQTFVSGQPVTVQSVSFVETAQNPQITVQVSVSNLRVYFAAAIGWGTAPTIGAIATAEAYNPAGAAGGPVYCTSCVRPWLIANCDQTLSGTPPTCAAPVVTLLNPGTNYGVTNPGCTPGGVIGESIDLTLGSATAPGTTLYGMLDVSNGAGIVGDYQNAITTCFTGATTCGTRNVFVMPVNAATQAATVASVENLLHIAAPGINQQDTLDPSVCPPQIHAGAFNPLVTNGVANVNDIITTSDSIVTAYIYDSTTPLTVSNAFPSTPQSVNIVGFAQIFVQQVAPTGDVQGYILGVASCGGNAGGACDVNAIQSSTMLPVRLISN
jgi:hypothetical protein